MAPTPEECGIVTVQPATATITQEQENNQDNQLNTIMESADHTTIMTTTTIPGYTLPLEIANVNKLERQNSLGSVDSMEDSGHQRAA